MKKIPIQLKKKDIGYVANHMLDIVDDKTFYLKANIRATLLAGSYELEDLVDITVDPDTLLTLHYQLGQRSENKTARIHNRLKLTLVPQLIALASVDPESEGADLELIESAGYVLTVLQERDAAIDVWEADEVTKGLTRLLGD